MAIVLSASIYRINSQDLVTGQSSTSRGVPATQGKIMGIPTAGIKISPLNEATTACGVAMVSIIEAAPTGLNQPSVKYYSPTAVATLISAVNA